MTGPDDGTVPHLVDVSAHGDGPDDGATVPLTISPELAFKIIGNETRLTILDTLWGPRKSGRMGFADLRKTVGMRDGSQFNFHLQKLLDGGFVEKVDGTYSLRQAGARVVCTVRAGYLTDHPELDPFETTGQCYDCGGSLTARYADEMFLVRCTACDLTQVFGWFPPNAMAGRTPEEALLAFDRTMRWVKYLAAGDICPVCQGSMDRTVAREWADVPVETTYLDPERDGPLRAWSVCRLCTAWTYVTPGEALLDHPTVVALYSEHGLDIRDCPRWELPWTVDPDASAVVSEDPLRIAVTVSLDGDERLFTLDEAFAVVDVA